MKPIAALISMAVYMLCMKLRSRLANVTGVFGCGRTWTHTPALYSPVHFDGEKVGSRIPPNSYQFDSVQMRSGPFSNRKRVCHLQL